MIGEGVSGDGELSETGLGAGRAVDSADGGTEVFGAVVDGDRGGWAMCPTWGPVSKDMMVVGFVDVLSCLLCRPVSLSSASVELREVSGPLLDVE